MAARCIHASGAPGWTVRQRLMSQVPADFSTIDMNMAVTGLKTLIPRIVSVQMKKPRLGRMNNREVPG